MLKRNQRQRGNKGGGTEEEDIVQHFQTCRLLTHESQQ